MHVFRREGGARCFSEGLKAKEQQGDIIPSVDILAENRYTF